MVCADTIAVLALVSVQAIWTDGAGRRVLPENRWMWVEVRPNVYVPEGDIGTFDRAVEGPATCRAFRDLDLAVEEATPDSSTRLLCLEWRSDDRAPVRRVCRAP
jgi:hypothetical protein